MILSGATGTLLKIDPAKSTITVKKHTGVQDFGYDKDDFDAEQYTSLTGKLVNLQLRDFMVVAIIKGDDEEGGEEKQKGE